MDFRLGPINDSLTIAVSDNITVTLGSNFPKTDWTLHPFRAPNLPDDFPTRFSRLTMNLTEGLCGLNLLLARLNHVRSNHPELNSDQFQSLPNVGEYLFGFIQVVGNLSQFVPGLNWPPTPAYQFSEKRDEQLFETSLVLHIDEYGWNFVSNIEVILKEYDVVTDLDADVPWASLSSASSSTLPPPSVNPPL